MTSYINVNIVLILFVVFMLFTIFALNNTFILYMLWQQINLKEQ